MQWLIDIIKAWVQAQGYLTACFVDRGDPANADYNWAALEHNPNWNDLDLSAIVPDGAKAVLLVIGFCAISPGRTAMFRKKGNFNVSNLSELSTQLESVYIYADIVVPCSWNRKIQYKTDFFDVSGLYITVKGWWL